MSLSRTSLFRLRRSGAFAVAAAIFFVAAESANAKPDKAAVAPVPVPGPAAAGTTSGRETVQRESRIEFDERMVQGQTAAGAIYLFQRGESEFHSMVKLPASFRDRTVHPILPPTTKR